MCSEKVFDKENLNFEMTREYIEKVKRFSRDFLKSHARTPKAFVLTLGCQQNEADSEKIAGMAEQMGYEMVDAPEKADLIMVNTCAIREHAEQRVLSLVGQYKHLKAANSELIIGVCGCMVVQEHRRNDLKFKYPYVDIVFGTSSLHRFPQILCEKLERGKRIFFKEENVSAVAEGIPIRRESKYRAWVSIMYGCNNFCSYCIVPYVRGRERSRLKNDIVNEVRSLVEQGYKDITLLGQNVNSYGKDTGENCDFADLLTELSAIEGDYYLRFMTSHPKDASKKLIDVMAKNPHIAKHFHLPLQSGSDEVLRVMNRKYDTEKYLSTIDYMRNKIPDIAISTDIIVGFPGETEDDFEKTLEMLKTCRFDMIFSFIYSPRNGTPASKMDFQIPPEVKSERFERLLSVQNEISLAKNQPLVGKTLRVLCDGKSKKNDNICSGRTESNKIVFFDAEEKDIGQFVNIKISRADTFALYGEKIN